MRIIAGKYGRRRVSPPKGLTLRPTTDIAKEALFNSLTAQYELEGVRVLDLFAGIGSISLEFVSRGAAAVTSVEKNGRHARFIKEAATMLDGELISSGVMTVVAKSAEQYLQQYDGEPFDFIYADPPYDLPWLAEIPDKVFASAAWGEQSIFVLEHPAQYDFSEDARCRWQRAYSAVHFSLFTLRQ